jgi:antitoxin HicB
MQVVPCIYPAIIQPDGGRYYLVTFPDVPEAGTDGATRDEALAGARDALLAALGGYVALRRVIPPPSPVRPGQVAIELPPLVAAKLALYQTMRARQTSNATLAHQLGVSVATVRRLLDLDHRSHIDQVAAALEACGQKLVVGLAA